MLMDFYFSNILKYVAVLLFSTAGYLISSIVTILPDTCVAYYFFWFFIVEVFPICVRTQQIFINYLVKFQFKTKNNNIQLFLNVVCHARIFLIYISTVYFFLSPNRFRLAKDKFNIKDT